MSSGAAASRWVMAGWCFTLRTTAIFSLALSSLFADMEALVQMGPQECRPHREPSMSEWVLGHRCVVSEVLEIVICCLCSVVTWQYTLQNDLSKTQDGLFGQQTVGRTADKLMFRPSPSLMLLSCLVFGCSVSSFTHRRHGEDPLQFVVYLVLLGTAAMVGYGAHASVHLILLGYLPWATCAAMVVSISGHGLYRWLQPNFEASQEDEEKALLAG